MKGIFSSRKFWGSFIPAITAVGAALTGEITWLQAIQAIVAAGAAYAVGTGIEDAGKK